MSTVIEDLKACELNVMRQSSIYSASPPACCLVVPYQHPLKTLFSVCEKGAPIFLEASKCGTHQASRETTNRLGHSAWRLKTSCLTSMFCAGSSMKLRQRALTWACLNLRSICGQAWHSQSLRLPIAQSRSCTHTVGPSGPKVGIYASHNWSPGE